MRLVLQPSEKLSKQARHEIWPRGRRWSAWRWGRRHDDASSRYDRPACHATHKLPFHLALAGEADRLRRGGREVDAGGIGAPPHHVGSGFGLRACAALPVGIVNIPWSDIDDVADYRAPRLRMGHPHLRPGIGRDAIGQRDAEFLVGDEMVVVGAIVRIGAAAEHGRRDIHASRCSAGHHGRDFDPSDLVDRPRLRVVVERRVGVDRDMHVFRVRVRPCVFTPLPRRLLAAEYPAVRDHVFDARILRQPQHLGERAGIDPVRGIVRDVHRGDDVVGIGVVIGFPGAVSSISDRAVGCFASRRRHRIDLGSQGQKALSHSPRHDNAP